jgi:hypothetical protein
MLGVFRLGLWLLPFKTMQRLVAETNPVTNQVPVDRITWAVKVAGRYVPEATCLTQALAAQALLGCFGHPAKLRIGVVRGDGEKLLAHAWVEIQGKVVLGGLEDLSRYTPLPPLEGERL